MCCSRKNNPEYKLVALLVKHYKARWPCKQIADDECRKINREVKKFLKEFSESIKPK